MSGIPIPAVRPDTPSNATAASESDVSSVGSSAGSATGYDAQAAALQPNAETAPTDDAGVCEPPRQFYLDYRDWIFNRYQEVLALTGWTQVDRVNGLLWQMEDIAYRCQYESIDVQLLNPAPMMGAAFDCGGVPPEWIEPARRLIELVERPTEGIDQSFEGTVEGSVYSQEDWNSRLGVPQYRTQSDNLASPEATCNGTSAAMVFERVGVSRQAVLAACESQMGLTEESTEEQKAETWKDKVEAYLKKENNRGSNYQKVRGRSQSSTTRTTMASSFYYDAQMEDLVLFLAYLKGIARTTIANSTDNLESMLTDFDGADGTNIARVEKISSAPAWDILSKKVADCLNNGGAAIYSFYHKGNASGESGKTHIITVQRVVSDGFIVDDPYGGIREDYSHDEYGDAFANKGSMSRTRKNKVNRSGTDWKVSDAQNLDTNESLGDSHKVTKKTITESFYYMQLLHRPGNDESDTSQ